MQSYKLMAGMLILMVVHLKASNEFVVPHLTWVSNGMHKDDGSALHVFRKGGDSPIHCM